MFQLLSFLFYYSLIYSNLHIQNFKAINYLRFEHFLNFDRMDYFLSNIWKSQPLVQSIARNGLTKPYLKLFKPYLKINEMAYDIFIWFAPLSIEWFALLLLNNLFLELKFSKLYYLTLFQKLIKASSLCS